MTNEEIATKLEERAAYWNRYGSHDPEHLGYFGANDAMLMSDAAKLLREQGWRPIESAPRDGTKIQIAVIDRAGNILSDTGNWVEGDTHEEWDEVDDGVSVKLWEDQDPGHWSSNYCLSELEEPTHWQPRAALHCGEGE